LLIVNNIIFLEWIKFEDIRYVETKAVMTMSWGQRAVFWLAALSVVDHTAGKITIMYY